MRKTGLVIVGMACCQSAFADLAYRADAGIGYSDNIRRTPVEETSEQIAVAGLELQWLERSRRLEADIGISGDYFHYRDDTFDDEFVGTADGQMILGIVPERFTWLMQDSFGQTQSDPFAPTTPETREDINYFTTGPDLIANLGASNTMRLFGRYSDTHYERSLLDSERTGAGVILARQLSGQNQIALQGVEERTRFDDAPLSDFDRRNAFLTYTSTGARTQLSVEGGYSWITRQDDSEMSGPLARVDLTREVSAASRFTLSFGTQFSDASQSLRGGVESSPAGGATGVVSSPDPFENRFASAGWNFNRNRTGFGLRASWSQDRYESQTVDQTVEPDDILQSDRTTWTYEMTFSRRLTANVTTNLIGAFTDEEFDATGATNEELRVGGTLDWQFGRHIGISLTAEHFERNSSVAATDFNENRGFLTLFYRYGEAIAR
jgi:hypothetical protein